MENDIYQTEVKLLIGPWWLIQENAVYECNELQSVVYTFKNEWIENRCETYIWNTEGTNIHIKKLIMVQQFPMCNLIDL
jgi:hypothetical protein